MSGITSGALRQYALIAENGIDRDAFESAADEIDRLRAENRVLVNEIDEALAITRAPDSTNDGGRENIADEMRRWAHNKQVEIDAIEADLAAARERESKLRECIDAMLDPRVPPRVVAEKVNAAIPGATDAYLRALLAEEGKP